jgi:hypothetical protein
MLFFLRLRRRVVTYRKRRLVALHQIEVIHETAPGLRISGLHQRGTSAPAIGIHDERRNHPTQMATPGSISDALKSLVDMHVLTKPAGSHGGYTFDDPTFREWISRLVWVSVPTSVKVTVTR